MGYLGLFLVILFYGYLCMTVRDVTEHRYFYSAVFCFIWFGISGFSGLVSYPSLLLIGLSLAVILLDQKQSEKSDVSRERFRHLV